VSAAVHAPRPKAARAEPGPARPLETPAAAGGEHALALALHPGAGRAAGAAAPPPAPPPPAAKTLRRTCAHGCDEDLVVHRKCAACAAAEEVERRSGVRQPLCPSCEREREAADPPLQRRTEGGGRPTLGAADGSGPAREGGAAASVRTVLGSGGGRPLDPGTRAFFEAGFGRGLGGVRVHTGPQADASARAVDALAYTVGNDVVFRAGHYAPASGAGKRLLAHELAHTLQQGQAGGPSLQGFSVSRPGDPAEREADAAADAVLRGGPVPSFSAAPAAVARDAGGAGAPPVVDAAAVSAAADRIIDRLDGYTSGADSTDILNEFSDTDAAFDRALMDELQRRGAVGWLFGDMTEEDGRTLRARLIRLHAAANILELIADDIVSRLEGWTSENDSHAILADFNGLSGGEIDSLLLLVEARAEKGSDATREWLFGDLDGATGFKLAKALYEADAPRASGYAAGWTVDRVYSLVSGYTSHADSTTIVEALEQVPETRQDYVRYRLDALCRASREQGIDDTLMEDLDVADYVRLQKIPGYALRPYDRQPSWYEEAWETIVSYVDYGLVLVEWVACGLVGVVTGILSVIWDIVVLVKDIVVAVWDLLGSLVYLLSGGAAGSGEWLAVKDFFRGIGHLFTDPGAVFDQMWEGLKADFDSIEGPLTQCRRAEFIVRKFINAIINIALIFVAGYGAVKGLAAGAQGVAQFANMVREVGFVRAVANVSGKVVSAGKGVVGATATAASELATALRSPAKLLGQVRGRLSKVLIAAEDEGYWNYLRTRTHAGVKGTLEEEGKFWRAQREYWRTRGKAQQAREAELGATVGEVEATLQEGKVPEGAQKTIASADEQARALDMESSQLHDEVTGARTAKPAETRPVETKPVETKPGETKPVEPKPAETKPAETKPAETKPAEEKAPGVPEKDKPPVKLPDEEGVTAKHPTRDGQHEVRIKHRAIERCSANCELCRRVHGPLLEERPDLDRLLARLEVLAQDDTRALQVAAEAALLDQRARTIYDLRAMGTADLEARAAAASASGDMVIANEARYVLARRARLNLTYEQFTRETLRTALGEGTTAELERAFGARGLPGLADHVGGERLGRLLTGATPDELAALSESIGNRALGALGQDLTGTELKALLAEWSETTVGWAAGELRGSEVRPLLTGLDEHSMRHLRDVRPSELLDLKNRLGASYLSTLGAEVDASALRHMFATISEDVARGIISERRQSGTLGQLNEFGRNIGQGRLTAAEGGTAELVSPPPVTAATGVLDTQMSVYVNEGRAGLITGTPWTGLTSRQQMALDRLIGMTTGECRAGLEQLRAGTPWSTLTPARQEAVRTLSPATGGVDLRVNPITVAEEGAPGAGLSRTGFDIPVDRNSAQYREVLRELEEIPNLNAGRTGEGPFVSVGGGGPAGAADRAVVADALFASNPSTPLTLYTADEGVYKALAQRANINPRTTQGGIHVKYRDGFIVTSPSTGLKLKVVPIK
jgi:hypothetical protein